MQIYLAIDLYRGRCVRLCQGRFDQIFEYDTTPLDRVRAFANLGGEWLHIVDLDRARETSEGQIHLIKEIVESTDLKIQIGGGIRTEKQIDQLLSIGASRVIIGSQAVNDPKGVSGWIERYGPEKIVLALDVRYRSDKNPYVATHAWQNLSHMKLFELIREYMTCSLKNLLCTDISRDGMCNGPNFILYSSLAREFPKLQIQASGGLSSLLDLKKLIETNIDGVVIGRALYEKRINLKKVLYVSKTDNSLS